MTSLGFLNCRIPSSFRGCVGCNPAQIPESICFATRIEMDSGFRRNDDNVVFPDSLVPRLSPLLLRHLAAAQCHHLRLAHPLADRTGDETRRDRRAVVVQDWDHPGGVDLELLDQQ